MPHFTQEQVISLLGQKPLLPLFYSPDADFTIEVVKTCYKAGVRAFEFTNRGEMALPVFKKLAEYANIHMPDLALGIGTIATVSQAKAFIEIGAHFIVQPFIDEDVAAYCVANHIAWLPGTMTFSEIHKAQTLGALAVKLFPGNIVGPDFLKAMHGPMPGTKVLVTGGVEPTEQSIKLWRAAGAYSLGLGSQLFTKQAIENRDMVFIEKTIQACFSYL
jgi:2-dehydro-3-deoxyphosphogluconate aldolase / (4S)-4-hydroxy-2-oxoglutarate aldolase